MIEVIHRAVDLGITFLDTSDMYGPHTNEILLGKVSYAGHLAEFEHNAVQVARISRNIFRFLELHEAL